MAIISDASGLCVNRPNATVAKPSKLNLFHSGYKDGVAGDRASAWVVKEVQFTGSLTLNDGKPELTRVEPVACSDPLLTCSPCRNWSDVKKGNGGNAPTHFSYRWYQSETDEVPDGCSGASIIGTCHLSNFGDMSECAAYRHVGMNMSELMCIEALASPRGLAMARDRSAIACSPRAAGGAMPQPTGEPVGEGGRSLRWSAIKVWLTGDVSLHFDLEVRAFNSNVG